MKSIPRAKISISYRCLIRFCFNLFRRVPRDEGEGLIRDFEWAFSSRYDYPKGVTVCAARAAFHLLLRTLPLRKCGEIIISGLHIADFVNVIRLTGFTPIVVDLEVDSLSVSLDDLEDKITDDTQLVLITHLSGYSTNMDKVMQLTRPRGIYVIEDCSQALLSTWNGQMLGTYGIAAIFSLSLLKPVSTITGGFILSRDVALLDKIRTHTSQWEHPSRTLLFIGAIKNIVIKFAMDAVVFHLLTRHIISILMWLADPLAVFQRQSSTGILRESLPANFFRRFLWQQAMLGLSQIPTMEKMETMKRHVAHTLYSSIRSTPDVWLPKPASVSESSLWLFPIFTTDRKRLQRYLLKCDIDSSELLLSCLAEEPAFSKLGFCSPNSASHKKRITFLPLYPSISAADMTTIKRIINNYTSESRNDTQYCE